MKRAKLREWYGRRFTSGSRITAFLLAIAFGIFLAFAQADDEKVKEENHKTEQSVE